MRLLQIAVAGLSCRYAACRGGTYQNRKRVCKIIMLKKRRCLRAAAFALCILLLLGLVGCGNGASSAALVSSGAGGRQQSAATSLPVVSAPPLPDVAPRSYNALPLPAELRAMWISFLEWEGQDISTEQAMRRTAGGMFDRCAAMGLNTVIVAVRSFSDALYESDIYPYSHLVNGVQGRAPGYDPLAVLVEEAHSRNLRLEAWVNPYRAHHNMYREMDMASTNPAVQNPQWTREGTDGSLWFNASLPEVQALVVQGAAEIVEKYDVDGIHFDDYFYSFKEDDTFDAEQYAAAGGDRTLEQWRRDNVNTVVAQTYQVIKKVNPTVSFGISPQGNNENNYNQEYSDVNLWMANPGYVDYVMPQLYWGFNYIDGNGNSAAAFASKCKEWAGYTRDESVKLYAGLGAYRVGDSDGGSNDQSEWSSGHNLADMVNHLRTVDGFGGFALFRYQFLTGETELQKQEEEALLALLRGETPA